MERYLLLIEIANCRRVFLEERDSKIRQRSLFKIDHRYLTKKLVVVILWTTIPSISA
ncbi:hypothetical protein [Ignatzschineria cameli]|uniref:hypothetical protein n=1 Tax=Ignatzschineria cameli TaxID=2182793 RepID=UPI0013009B59|nr:hypothetical protein [Ignatzschineria cameli]